MCRFFVVVNSLGRDDPRRRRSGKTSNDLSRRIWCPDWYGTGRYLGNDLEITDPLLQVGGSGRTFQEILSRIVV